MISTHRSAFTSGKIKKTIRLACVFGRKISGTVNCVPVSIILIMYIVRTRRKYK